MKKKVFVGIGILLVVALIAGGVSVYKSISNFRQIDANYAETFPDFTAIKSNVAGKNLLIHLKTGFNFDDAQGCVAFNMAFAALKVGLQTTVLVDASGTYIFADDQLFGYRVPERMRKSLAAQAQMELVEIPKTYGELTIYLADNGVEFIVNGTMNVVSGKRNRVYQKFENYDFIKPLSTFETLEKIMTADRYLAY